MDSERLDYPRMIQDAVKGVVRQAMRTVEEEGFPGDHHFFITFRTSHPEVAMPESLHERFPEEMRIILQHQFWDLEVAEDGFAVTLSFNGQRAALAVPFDAVTSFFDPAANFALHFEVPDEEGENDEEPLADASASEGASGTVADVVSFEAFRKRQ